MKILLHACCGPCSLEPIRVLQQAGHDITIGYFNSNIDPQPEYEHRLQTLIEWAKEEGIPVVEGVYTPDTWHKRIADAWQPEDDRAHRCQACYRLRFEDAAAYAYEHGFEGLGTTLSVSPYQFIATIQEELERACEPYPGLTPVFEDYRPFYPDATQRSRDLGMYRQNYCGCRYSYAEAKQEREERKAERKAKKEAERAAKLAQLTTSDFDYDLPEHCIAQTPAPIRDECKLLVMNRQTGSLQDKIFRDIYDLLKPGDLLVANETRVMPARLLGAKRETGGMAEVFLLRERFDVEPKQSTAAVWEALVRPGKRLKPGAIVDVTDGQGNTCLSAEVIDWVDGAEKGERLVRLTTPLTSLDDALHQVGHTPLPPYIKHYAGDEELYQTVYAREERSAAAPTAGLHFTPELLDRIKDKGVGFETVHLEVGLDTFRVVDVENPFEHHMHTERYTVPASCVAAIESTEERGGRIIAVGTTSVRSLESAWDATQERLIPREGEHTNLFIFPGYRFNVVDGLITNFHVPRSTLMMLVSAFASRDKVMAAYRHALKRHYRFLSFGDAIFIH